MNASSTAKGSSWFEVHPKVFPPSASGRSGLMSCLSAIEILSFELWNWFSSHKGYPQSDSCCVTIFTGFQNLCNEHKLKRYSAIQRSSTECLSNGNCQISGNYAN